MTDFFEVSTVQLLLYRKECGAKGMHILRQTILGASGELDIFNHEVNTGNNSLIFNAIGNMFVFSPQNA